MSYQIEVNLSVLWEGARDSPTQVRARNEAVEEITEILGQVEIWTQAEKIRSTN